MLARSGALPTRCDWSYEVKWDGFRAIVSTEGAPLRVRSRRGWATEELVPELSALPVSATLDGELVAFGDDDSPDFPLLCERMLMRRSGIHVTYVVFDLLSLDAKDLTCAPYSERRANSKRSGSTASTGRHPKPSMTGAPCSTRSARTN
jgi:bifunctional non-homologous end joining protein LigD